MILYPLLFFIAPKIVHLLTIHLSPASTIGFPMKVGLVTHFPSFCVAFNMLCECQIPKALVHH